MLSQSKIFILGATLGAVFGATVLASIAHLLLIVLAVAGGGAVLHRTRRLLVARPGREKRHLKSFAGAGSAGPRSRSRPGA
jgi:hypothetical protein